MSQTILFFDLDGTLMINPFWKVVFPTISQAFADLTGFTSEEMFHKIMGEHDRRLENPYADRPRTMDWEDIIQTVAQQLGISYAGTAEALVVDHAAPPYSSTIDQAEIVLSQLKNGHRRLVVSTMGLSKYQVPVLRGLGLYDLFDEVLTPDLTGYLKTEREFYKNYPDQPARRIHIGDRYDHDCYYPKQFGSQAILRLPIASLAPYDPLERPQYLHTVYTEVGGRMNDLSILPDAIVVNLAELPSVIKELEN